MNPQFPSPGPRLDFGTAVMLVVPFLVIAWVFWP